MDSSYRFEVELREFVASGLDPELYNSDVSVALQPEYKWEFNEGDSLATFTPYGRWASRDQERRHYDLREANINHVTGNWELLAGVTRVFWGVTESSHLVDIINQTNFLESTDGEDKLGQPMVRIGRVFDRSTLELYVLPYFRKREFLAPNSPLGLPFIVNNDPIYQSSDEENHIDVSLRYSGYVGIVDYGLSWFNGTSRDPDFVPDAVPGVFRPFYPQIDQFGLDLQVTSDAWLWKLETIRRESDLEDFTALVGGFEYTLFNMMDSLFDLGLLLEYHHDTRDDPATVLFQNDVFAGMRFGFTDTESSEILAGLIQDQDDQSMSFRVEANRRVFGDARINLEAQFFSNVDPGNITYSLRDSDFIQLSLEVFF